MRRTVRSACCVATSLAMSLMFVPTAALAAETPDSEGSYAPIPMDEGAYEPDELIVQLESAEEAGRSGFGLLNAASSEERAIAALEDAGAQVEETLSDANRESGAVLNVDVSSFESMEQAASELAAQPGVKYVQPNYKYYLADNEGAGDGELDPSEEEDDPSSETLVNDPQTDQQYYLDGPESHGANVRAAWESAKSDYGVTVAVLDTGCYLDHEDLSGTLISEYAWDAYNKTQPGVLKTAKNPTGDIVGHGTHVCGIVAAQANNAAGIAGASYNARVLPIKVFNDNSGYYSYSSTSDLISAYEYIFDLVDQGKVQNLHVINMSLGGYGEGGNDQVFESAINTAKDDYSIVTVCAGGNGDSYGNAKTEKQYPSDFDACVAVTALNKEGGNATFSDYNECKDISAPGVDIYSTYNESSSSYTTMSGTSMASPLVAGSMALLWAKQPQLTVGEACTAIYSTAKAVNDTVLDRSQTSGSHGAIDAAAAVQYVAENYGSSDRTSLSSCTLGEISFQYWTGEAVEPELQLFDGETLLQRGTDYTVSFRNNVKAGTATAIVVGTGSYTGRISSSFNIYYNMADAEVLGVNESYDFMGSAIEPAPMVRFNGKLLTNGSDYTVDYVGSNAAGTAQIVIEGMGSYHGKKIVEYQLLAKDLADAQVYGLQPSYVFNGSAIEPSFNVVYGSRLLVAGADYEYAIIGNDAVGQATLTITGKGEFTGAKAASFAIVAAGSGGSGSGGNPPQPTTPEPSIPDEPVEPEEPDVPAAPAYGAVVDNALAPTGEVYQAVVTGVAPIIAPNGIIASGTVSISGLKSFYADTLQIPTTVTVDGYTYVVTGIAAEAFKDNETVTSVVLPATIMRIGQSAFEDCTSLAAVSIPGSVSVVESYAFKGCSSLKTVVLNKGIKEIGRSAFSRCSNLRSVIIPEGISRIGKFVFYKTGVKTLRVKSAALTKAGVKGCLKGSSVTTVKVPKSKVKVYAKIFTKANAGKKVAVKR